MISHEVFIHIHQGCFAGTGAIVRLPQCQRSKPGGYGKISQCITTTKHSKAKTVCIFLGIYCMYLTPHTLMDAWEIKAYWYQRSSFRYTDSLYKDKAVVSLSYLYNGNFCCCKLASFDWNYLLVHLELSPPWNHSHFYQSTKNFIFPMRLT